MLQDNVSFFGDFSEHATTLEAVDTTEAEGTVADPESDIEGNSPEDTEAGQDMTKKDTAYTKTADKDASVLVVRQDTVLTKDINDAIDILNNTRGKVLGCILNGVTSQNMAGSGHYGYGGHYGKRA